MLEMHSKAESSHDDSALFFLKHPWVHSPQKGASFSLPEAAPPPILAECFFGYRDTPRWRGRAGKYPPEPLT